MHISQITVPTSTNLAPGSTATKGVTIVSPRPPKNYYKPCHAGAFTFNGNGELTGSRQVDDWGFINTPIAFTNSLSLGTVFDGMWDWVLDKQEEAGWDLLTKARNYGTPVVGETADWLVNGKDLRSSRVKQEVVRRAFSNLKSKEDGAAVQEGQFGGGAGMTCHQFAGGTGTASRIVGGGEGSRRDYTVAALCQSNYGHLPVLTIGGVPVGKILQKEKDAQASTSTSDGAGVQAQTKAEEIAGRTKDDGSILILIITDAPLATHQLNRLARHATAGLAQVGTYGIGRTHSGDIFLAVSTAEHGPEQLEGTNLRWQNPTQTYEVEVVKNESIDPYFHACTEAVEEAILNSMVGGRDGTVAMDGRKVEGLPVDRVKELLEKHLFQV